MLHEKLHSYRESIALAGDLSKEVAKSGIQKRVSHKEVVIPGLAAALSYEIEQSTDWKVTVGPICAAELPLFLADTWIPPST